jgi:hypothetical protein
LGVGGRKREMVGITLKSEEGWGKKKNVKAKESKRESRLH